MTLIDSGEDAVVRTYTTTDPTETPGEFESPDDTVTKTETKALFQQTLRQTISRDASGEDVSLDMTIFIPGDIEVKDVDSGRRPSEIERVDTGEVFRIEAVVREAQMSDGESITRCNCTRKG